MCGGERMEVGSVGWLDLTIENAEDVRDFYKSVIGFKSSDVDMDGYNDFVMLAPGSGEGIGGVCHARGGNKDIPPQWILYFIVEDVDASVKTCESLGGKALVGPKKMGEATYCVIQDPAGAVCALYNPGS